jgi:hypothetical protein
LNGCKITEDMAKEDLDKINEELNYIHKWRCIGIAAGLVGLLGGVNMLTATAPRVSPAG